ncbi:hypothetical protein CEXT_544031 [Caerostris extrusa]|uniref:Uncharacterized protein n=1 Tax=Caerostris extrusa TaxID=172846 RepID=A0AAV4SLM1_CAEEX|nr:hypothetical protein CEXT_544031 [Caerostris extrusa]
MLSRSCYNDGGLKEEKMMLSSIDFADLRGGRPRKTRVPRTQLRCHPKEDEWDLNSSSCLNCCCYVTHHQICYLLVSPLPA